MKYLLVCMLIAAIAIPATARPKKGLGAGLTMDNKDLIVTAVEAKTLLASIKNPKDEKEIKRVAAELDKKKETVGTATVADALKLVSLDHEDLRPLALSFLQRHVTPEVYAGWIKIMKEELTKRSTPTK